MKLFVDSDGVFYDFTQHVIDLFGVHPDQFDGGPNAMWETINANDTFWQTMPLMPDALLFWKAIQPARPTVLTGCHRDDYDNIVSHKEKRWLDDFSHSGIITCLSKNKAMHMTKPGDILVDDTYRIIKKWEAAGGRGVLFKSALQAIADLKTLGVI